MIIPLKGGYFMQTKTTSLLKGLGVGMIAGAAVTFTVKSLLGEEKHNITRGSAKIVKAMGDAVDGIQTIFR